MHQHTITFSIPEMEQAARTALINEMEETCHVAVQATRIRRGDWHYEWFVKHSLAERIDAVRSFCESHAWVVTGYED